MGNLASHPTDNIVQRGCRPPANKPQAAQCSTFHATRTHPTTKNKPKAALSSCNLTQQGKNSVKQKIKSWQEIICSLGQRLRMMTVIDRGVTASSRRTRIKKFGTLRTISTAGNNPEEERRPENRRTTMLTEPDMKKTLPKKVKSASTRTQPTGQQNSIQTQVFEET